MIFLFLFLFLDPADYSLLKFKKLSGNAICPRRGSRHAAGLDLASAESKIIPAQSTGVIKTDLAFSLPARTYGRLAARSSLAVQHSIGIGAGVIDRDYRGNISIVIINRSREPFEVRIGDYVAQLIIEKICSPRLLEVDDLGFTQRGELGFGGASNGY